MNDLAQQLVGTKAAFFDFVTHFGGAQRSTVELAARLAKLMDILVWDAYGSSCDYIQAAQNSNLNVDVLFPSARHQSIGSAGQPFRRALKFGRSVPEQFALIRSIRHRIVQDAPDIVWTNSRKGFVALAASAPRHLPLVYFLRGGEGAVPSPSFVRQLLRRRASRVFVLSDSIGQLLVSRGYPARRISVVSNAVEVSEVTARAQLPLEAPLPQSSKPLRLLMAATLVPNKGQLQAVRVLHRLASLGEDPVLFLAGDVPAGGDHRYPRRIVELAATLGVDDRVEFLGWRSDVLALIRNASAVLVLSESEGVPRVILEAMAIGVPVVATPVGGVRDLVCDGVTGWV